MLCRYDIFRVNATNTVTIVIFYLRKPTFSKTLDCIPRSSKDQVRKMLQGLNRTQRQAIKRVLVSDQYTLVVGKLLMKISFQYYPFLCSVRVSKIKLWIADLYVIMN